MAKKRNVTNKFEAYLEEKNVSDETLAVYLGVTRNTFAKMRKDPLSIKLGYSYKLAIYFKEYFPFFIDHIVLGSLMDVEQDINTEGSDWDLAVVNEMKQATIQNVNTSDNERKKAQSKIQAQQPSRVDPETGVVVLVDENKSNDE